MVKMSITQMITKKITRNFFTSPSGLPYIKVRISGKLIYCRFSRRVINIPKCLWIGLDRRTIIVLSQVKLLEGTLIFFKLVSLFVLALHRLSLAKRHQLVSFKQNQRQCSSALAVRKLKQTFKLGPVDLMREDLSNGLLISPLRFNPK